MAQWKTIEDSPYFSAVNPCNFDLFLKKEALQGKWFCQRETIQEAVGQSLADIRKISFLVASTATGRNATERL
jgi:hypothetical protein